MIAHDLRIVRLLASPGFRRSRVAAAGLSGDAKGLQRLVARVEARRHCLGLTDGVTAGVDLDILCAILDARIEELHDVTAPRPSYSHLQDARLRMVIAALHYLVDERDPADTHGLDGAAILRWVTRIAQGELPAH